MIRQITEWYDQTSASDRAGAGFYFSTDPMDSRAFGNDLLIVEIQSDSALKPEDDARIKARYAEARAAGKLEELPLFTRYAPTWHVISRPSASTEAVKVRFRRPRPDDAVRIYASRTRGLKLEDPLTYLSRLSTSLQYDRFELVAAASAQEFLDSMLIDSTFGELDTIAELPDSAVEPLFEPLRYIAKNRPSDPRTGTALQRWFTRLLAPELKGISDLGIRQALELMAFLPDSERHRWTAALGEKLSTAQWNAHFESMLFHFDQQGSRMLPAQKDLWRRNLVAIIRLT